MKSKRCRSDPTARRRQESSAVQALQLQIRRLGWKQDLMDFGIRVAGFMFLLTVLFGWIFGFTFQPDNSMAEKIQPGDLMVYWKQSNPQLGDLVVYEHQETPVSKTWIQEKQSSGDHLSLEFGSRQIPYPSGQIKDRETIPILLAQDSDSFTQRTTGSCQVCGVIAAEPGDQIETDEQNRLIVNQAFSLENTRQFQLPLSERTLSADQYLVTDLQGSWQIVDDGDLKGNVLFWMHICT